MVQKMDNQIKSRQRFERGTIVARPELADAGRAVVKNIIDVPGMTQKRADDVVSDCLFKIDVGLYSVFETLRRLESDSKITVNLLSDECGMPAPNVRLALDWLDRCWICASRGRRNTYAKLLQIDSFAACSIDAVQDIVSLRYTIDTRRVCDI